MNTERTIAAALLEIKAVKLSPRKPFTWASGLKSPVYCDNRKTLSYPETRRLICESFAARVAELYPDVQLIAGVATGAIAHGALLAERLNLPFVYVRAAAKSHGLENLVEGELPDRAKVVVVEDLVSTGGSSIAAVEALRRAGAEVLGLVAIFSYEFAAAEENFKNAGCRFDTLSNYSALLNEALASNYISGDEPKILREWHDAASRNR
ncbi:MAG: orotate phosphoribosyltransferase [Prevotellaceae bacterium]|jgi:orotate phosphoribosyltransferase|nr:orotate phosphoribosyltransferase [Prevotellaceae bacterium]